MQTKKIHIVLFLILSLFASVLFLLRPTHQNRLQYQSEVILITRDRYNIPSIRAPSRKAYLYALGYVQAEDRLFQMQFKRYVMEGRLSEFIGQKALALDKFFREVDLKGWGVKIAQKMKKQDLGAYLDYKAYADGINDLAHSKIVLPMDFHLTGMRWDNWTVSTISGMRKQFEWSQAFSAFQQYARSHLLSKYTRQECQDFFPNTDNKWAFKSTTIIEDEYIPKQVTTQFIKKQPDEMQFTPQIMQQIINLGLFEYLRTAEGSNSWVISGKHTQSGKPLLANDPHLDNCYPSMWYQVYGNYSVNDKWFSIAGAGPSGIPFVMGKGNYLAFGVTTVYTDNQDLFRQTIKQNQYLVDGKWRPLKIRQEVIKIKGKPDVQYTVRQTHRGPIIHYLIGAVGNFYIPEGLSIQWTGFSDKWFALYQLTNNPQIQSMQSFDKILKSQAITIMNANMIFATKDGHIGYQQMGSYPIRRNKQSGNFVKDGSTSADDWTEILPTEFHLRFYDPQCGYICTANNKISSNKYYDGLHDYQIYTARADRVKQMIQTHIGEGKKFNVNKMKQMMLDTVDVYCRQILPFILAAIPEAQPQLVNFDCNFSSNSYQATMYEVLMFEFHHLTKPHKTENISIMTFHQNQQRLFNLIKSNSRNDLLSKAWTQTIANLTAFFKTQSRSEWKWGDYHKDAMHHIPFGSLWLRNFYDRTFPGSGNLNTVNVGKMNKVQFGNFEISHRATYRSVYSLAENEDSWFIIDSGSSEHVFSQHYDDQWKLFSQNKMIPLLPSPIVADEL